MTMPKLPPLPGTALIFPNGKPERVMSADMVERAVEARERILLARIAELEADAQRYRWLRADNAYFPEEEGIRGGDDLDAAIDEAMQGDA